MVRFLLFSLLLLFSVRINGQSIDTTDVGLIMIIDEAPVFAGDLKEFIQRELKYPISAEKDTIEGTVFVSFMIDSLGLTSNHKIVRGVRDDLNNEALRIAKRIKFDKPAFQKGKYIPVRFVIPVVFILSSNSDDSSKNDSLITSVQRITLND